MVDRIGNVMRLLNMEEYPLRLDSFTSLLDDMNIEYDVYTVEYDEDDLVDVSRVTVYDDEDETILISYFVTDRLVKVETL